MVVLVSNGKFISMFLPSFPLQVSLNVRLGVNGMVDCRIHQTRHETEHFLKVLHNVLQKSKEYICKFNTRNLQMYSFCNEISPPMQSFHLVLYGAPRTHFHDPHAFFFLNRLSELKL